jgi:hypothetical protein
MRKWPVTDIVQQDGNTHGLFFFGSYFMAFLAEDIHCALHQIHGSEGMVKARVVCSRINQIAQAQLRDSAQPLKIRMFYQLKNELICNGNEAVDRVVENFVFECRQSLGCLGGKGSAASFLLEEADVMSNKGLWIKLKLPKQ